MPEALIGQSAPSRRELQRWIGGLKTRTISGRFSLPPGFRTLLLCNSVPSGDSRQPNPPPRRFLSVSASVLCLGSEELEAQVAACGGMETPEPESVAEGEDRASLQRPRTRSNPEGAEDRGASLQASVGSRSEGEGEAAVSEDAPPGAAASSSKEWQTPVQAPEFQVRTPRVNCPEKVVICLDLCEEMSSQKLESFNGSKVNTLNISQKMIEMFVRTKHKIDKQHEFALVVVNDDATWLSGFTSDPREVCSCLYDLETNICESFNLEGLFNLIQQRSEFPVTENVQTIPPPYVIRMILIYSRPASQPQFSITEPMKKLLQCPYFFFDLVYIHNGAEEKEDEMSWKFRWLQPRILDLPLQGKLAFLKGSLSWRVFFL
ncbi:BRISC and BRCA1-A complex member 1 isoform X2 [Rhinatrema bivittatum]|uniref:BRISC and BRCA1-A complex member 1 isoform X2 n=1 Tax=Rhinatrema bivittatum TaxID=194408 RepID=UPI0011264756|nr:BRISC and BRCA1-A complex member 1 isoform X2 [Rhinatrema bivittatum]